VSTQQINDAVMQLPENEQLDLARRIVASIVTERDASGTIAEAVQGIEDIVTGKLAALNETEFRNALK
jgi:hypothetical protein